ncbi:hypothetical protein BJV74DRAFT_889684 [Russula compacta]|nr:hypothetical protein BJV74DRAFT_889684 [Russula compacta]
MSSTSSFLGQYEPLDVIENGSSGIIRKVKQNKMGSNILNDLDRTHIVQYYDRYVDRDAGTLYILVQKGTRYPANDHILDTL